MNEAGLFDPNETLKGKGNLIVCFHWVVILHSSIFSEKNQNDIRSILIILLLWLK